MARDRRFDMEDLASRPGTYFNPQTEVLVIIDDSTSIDSEIFNMEEFEGADWVLISDDVPVDEPARDEILENFQATFRGPTAVVVDDDLETDEDDEPEEKTGFGDDDGRAYSEDDD
jgi:hypothetical protein